MLKMGVGRRKKKRKANLRRRKKEKKTVLIINRMQPRQVCVGRFWRNVALGEVGGLRELSSFRCPFIVTYSWAVLTFM